MIHIAHVTSSHPADDVRILRRECVSLSDAGFRVSYVVAGANDAEVRGVHVIGVPGGGRRFARFVLNPWRVLKVAARLRPDVLHLHDPELLPWVPLLRLRGYRVVIDIHENIDGLLVGREWVPRWAVALANGLAVLTEQIAAMTANAVVVAGEDLAQRLARHHPHLVRNFPAAEDIPAEAIPRNDRGGIVIFVGAITRARAIRELIDALPLVAAHRPIRLRLVGKCQPASLLAELEAREGWRHVEYLGHRPRAEVATMLGNADVGVALLSPKPNHYGVRANKLFEYMASGLAVLASDFPLWREFVERWNCGLVVDPTDPATIASGLRNMLDDPATTWRQGANGRAAVQAHLNWTVEAPRLLAVYRAIIGDRAQPGVHANVPE